jgi:hypothetical protein
VSFLSVFHPLSTCLRIRTLQWATAVAVHTFVSFCRCLKFGTFALTSLFLAEALYTLSGGHDCDWLHESVCRILEKEILIVGAALGFLRFDFSNLLCGFGENWSVRHLTGVSLNLPLPASSRAFDIDNTSNNVQERCRSCGLR